MYMISAGSRYQYDLSVDHHSAGLFHYVFRAVACVVRVQSRVQSSGFHSLLMFSSLLYAYFLILLVRVSSGTLQAAPSSEQYF